MNDNTDYDFDRIINRRPTDSHKWNKYDKDVLPMWIADMDFASPNPVISALQKRVRHGVFGYPLHPPEELCNLIIDQMAKRYGWKVKKEDFIFLPGTHDGFKLACRMVGKKGDEVLMHTPLYPPLLKAPATGKRRLITSELIYKEKDSYSLNYEDFQNKITNQTRLFILCNPHNPVGKVYSREELEKIGEICLQNNLIICSDDVHSDLVYSGNEYTPIASLSPKLASRTITLMAPSKTYNLAGLKLSMAIIQNKELWSKIRSQLDNYPAGGLGIVGATAAYRDGENWYRQLMEYLENNRDFLHEFVNNKLPGISMISPEGTFLAWLDCRKANLQPDPYNFFINQAKVALGDGRNYGVGGNGFVRLNFGCPRPLLINALQQLQNAFK